jgi:hypothetical protein
MDVNIASMKSPLEERCNAEIVRLHESFVTWFTASCDNTTEFYESEIASVLSPSFSMVPPSGNVVPAKVLNERLKSAYGVHSEHGITIDIKNVEVLSGSNFGHLVRYEEWQRSGSPEKETARVSTAFLQESEGSGQNNLLWLNVHETWMPGKGP